MNPSGCVVVGSGPAGVACARALLDGGQSVLMLDGGLALEEKRAQFVQRFAQSKPAYWPATEVAEYQSGMSASVGGVPQKLVYGSDFPYREADDHLALKYEGIGLRASLARGGLSNVWGAAMMPYLARDVDGWPFPPDTLAQHYVAVLRLTGLSACSDDLAAHYPLFTNSPTDLRPSTQAQHLLKTMESNRAALSSAGIIFGRARLAVRGNTAPGADGCVYCRLCMHGCPYGFIYNSTDTVAQFRAHPRFAYQPGVVVESVREDGQGAEVSGYDRQSRKPLNWRCDRAFLAAGPIGTTRILLRSLNAYDRTVYLKDSQYFLAPLFLLSGTPGASSEWFHALSQVFVEILGAGGERSAHVQIYSYSDLIGQAVAKAFGPLRRPLNLIIRTLQERLLIAQGFLHSDLSSKISICLKKANGKDRLELGAELNPAAKDHARKVLSTLRKHARHIGAIPLPFMAKFAEPGRSFHCGGSFPMSRRPEPFQTDLLGRVPGWGRIHAVDSTALPSVPATTITFSVMANAHRIGFEATREMAGS